MQSDSEIKGKVSFYTLGCRLNIFETDGLSNVLSRHGFKTIPESQNPDVIVVNTCTVTNKADSKNRNIIRYAIKSHPGAQVWVTGCYAETDRDVIEKIPGITGVVGNSEKSNLPYMILEKQGIETSHSNNDRFSYADVIPVDHTRGYLKIQDGCNRVCSYCKIPQARGKGVSRNFKDIIDQVKFMQDNGIGEIILTGVNLGWYRNEEKEKSFNKLLKEILNVLEYSRLRLSSIEPSDVGIELAEIMKHPRFCNYLHVPLQSGSSRILRQMKRSYSAETFRKRIEIVKERNPDVFLGTDVIVGFPSESEIEFSESLNLLSDLGFAKIHVFPFSLRKGTGAESMADSVSKEKKKERVKILNSVSNEMYRKYAEKNIGIRREAIIEGDGQCITDNYLKVRIPKESISCLKTGQFVDVVPTEYTDLGVSGICAGYSKIPVNSVSRLL